MRRLFAGIITLLLSCASMTLSAQAQSSLDIYHNTAIYSQRFEAIDVRTRPVNKTSVTLEFGGKAICDEITAYGANSIYFTGGIADTVTAADRSSVTLDGGRVRVSVSANNYSNVTLNPGVIIGELNTFDNSSVTITGGVVTGKIIVEGQSHVVFEGESFSAVPTGTYQSEGTTGKIYDITLTNLQKQTFHYTLYDADNDTDRPGYHNAGTQFNFRPVNLDIDLRLGNHFPLISLVSTNNVQ